MTPRHLLQFCWLFNIPLWDISSRPRIVHLLRGLPMALLLSVCPLNAQSMDPDPSSSATETEAATLPSAPAHEEVGFFNRAFDLSLRENVNEPRSVFWAPYFTSILPGLDQWWEGQEEAGTLYSGLAVLGLGVRSEALGSYNLNQDKASAYNYLIGSKLYMMAGNLSSYASFRSAVRTQKPQGRFEFLTEEETTRDLLMAPFQFSELKKPSTWIPLAIVTGIAALQIEARRTTGNNEIAPVHFSPIISYGAGVGEEADYRGWLLPVLTDTTDSPFVGNLGTSFLFALAHRSPANPVPWPQFLMGYYLGWLAQKNKWTLQQSIFVHTWWDVIAFTPLMAQIGPSSPQDEQMLWLPPFYMTF